MKRTSTLFSEPQDQRKLKPIELVKFLDNDNCYTTNQGKVVDLLEDADLSNFSDDNFKLISRGHQYDIIAVYSSESCELDRVAVFLGHWNDGIAP